MLTHRAGPLNLFSIWLIQRAFQVFLHQFDQNIRHATAFPDTTNLEILSQLFRHVEVKLLHTYRIIYLHKYLSIVFLATHNRIFISNISE